jgi:hypothetical protein
MDSAKALITELYPQDLEDLKHQIERTCPVFHLQTPADARCAVDPKQICTGLTKSVGLASYTGCTQEKGIYFESIIRSSLGLETLNYLLVRN